MFKYNAIEKTQYIDKEFKRYIKSTFRMDNPHLLDQFNMQIDNVKLIKGPFISVAEPFKTGRTIRQLVEANILNERFLNLHNLKIDRPLYLHQEESIVKAKEGKNLVVSTGTGSGKTESFLIPIINRIFDDRDNDIDNCGVQALLLYPMNALANDQRERLREILQNNLDITFGFYTGETSEKQNDALSRYREENDRDPLKNEIISREALRENPPNILFTNYSMLEYMLIRPYDHVLFEPENTKFWHYIVMDEAHVYRGSLGIDISLLLKRLQGLIQSKPNFILTSATLAQEEKDFPNVANFARTLTSRPFSNDCVVVGTRRRIMKPSNSFKLDRKRYSKYLENTNYISEDYEYLLNGSEKNVENQLNQLIIHDENFYNLIKTIKGPKDLVEIKKDLPEMWENSEITSLIDLVSRINASEDNFLIDIRYHTFVKALDGAHVILKPEIKLFLKNINYYNLSNESESPNMVKTFQLGLCKYCNGAYLMGIIKNENLYKIDDEELYTTYGEEYDKQTDFLLIKDLIGETEEINTEKIKHINICNKCGHLYDVENLNAEKCECGEDYIIETIMSDKTNSKNKTNLTTCLNCGSTNTKGVVESFYIGKDAATALVAQILYRAMGKKTNEPLIVSDNPFLDLPEQKNYDDYIKQFIAFSDSRSQASYFATFFDSIQTRFLRKRTMVNLLEDKNHMKARNFIDDLEYLIDKEKLFEDDNKKREAWITYLIDLLDVERKFSLSGLGLLAFVPDIDLSDISEKLIGENFDGMKKSTFKKLVYFIIEKMRSMPAIEFRDDSRLPWKITSEHLQYRNNDLTGLVLIKSSNSNNSKYERALLSKNNSDNTYINYLVKSLNVDFGTARKYLKYIWNFLVSKKIIVESNCVYKYNALNFNIYNRNNIDWYQCNKCKTLTYINVNNACVKYKCDGTLVVVSPDVIHADNYYFSEYLNNELENIRVEEHTAQINKEKGREYQRDFKNGKINILSSSTTFEMGVDLGNLDTVYMRNVPPTPANYIQRAGRAGRRKETAAYVITFASNQSHDYNFYSDPIKMIEGNIKPPVFEVENFKIIDRHILSVAMAAFFRNNPNFFTSIEHMIYDKGKERLIDFIDKNKTEFTKYISENIDRNFEGRFDLWVYNQFKKDESSLNVMIDSTREKINQIDDYLSVASPDGVEFNKYSNMRKDIINEPTLNVLSKYSVIPKYGFPVDTVRLEVPGETKLDLNRDLAIAISEYAPGSEVMVDKVKYTSRYINLARTAPIEYFYKICKSCKSLSMSLNDMNETLKTCKNCGTNFSENAQKFIKPIYGFVSELDPNEDRVLKPKKTYASDYYYVGSLSKNDIEEKLGNIVKVRLVKDNKLAVINDSPFFMCENCGYTELDYKNYLYSSISKEHKLPNSLRVCSNKKLVSKSLGHDFTTDVVLLSIENNDVKYPLEHSLLFAILEGISMELEIERSDISGIIQNVNNKKQIILFDTVPGGAGHVRRLLDKGVFISVINTALKKVSQECCDETSSCYNCLRNYQNEKLHPKLARGIAKSSLQNLINGLESLYNSHKTI